MCVCVCVCVHYFCVSIYMYVCTYTQLNQLTGCVEISFRAAVSSERLSMSNVYTYGFPINNSV